MGKKKILLVDDEPELVDLVKMRLETNDYEVITAYDGQEALRKARGQNPDLIILDLMLPKMDGYMICGLLKKDARYSKIPIVMFTARAQVEDKVLGENLGADAYLVKPFDPTVLLSKIKELLGE
ncbi:MAG: response regulator [Candidatus Omnitrophota bacterium]|nr:MAG: response regulator [Candidatus Omnitrophota bacterium]